MEKLEQAANIIMAPPHGITVEERHIAESIILQFRSTESPYIMCCQILESSENEYVLYEAANLIGCSVAKEWREICQGQSLELKQYLLQYLVSNSNIFHSVREHIVKTLAFIIEREETPVSEKDKYYGEIIQLLNSGNPSMCILACCMVQTICQEKVKIAVACSHVTNETEEFNNHKKFEKEHMLEMYKTVLTLLSEISGDAVVKDELKPALLKLVLLAEEILTWPYVHGQGEWTSFGEIVTKKTGVYSHGLFDPHSEWKSYVLSEDTIALFFRLYEKFKEDWQLGHHLMVCLVQLSTLTGSCLVDFEDNKKYVKTFCSYLHEYLFRNAVKESEALGIATIIMKLSLTNKKLHSENILGDTMGAILRDILMLTLRFIAGSAEERHADPEDQLYTEALDKILTAIDTIDGHTVDDIHQNILMPMYGKIFQAFLLYHLSPPDGYRLKSESDNDEVTSEIQPDYAFYSIQISIITQLGALEIESCLNLLTEMLEKRGSQLMDILSCRLSLNTVFLDVFEDLNWLLMIAGQLVSNPYNIDSVGKCLLNWYSLKRDNISIPETTYYTMQSYAEKPFQSYINDSHVNAFTRMMAAIYHIWKLDLDALAADNSILLSPEVSNTMIWLMRKFNTRFFFDELDMVSVYFNTETRLWMMNFAADAIATIFRKRSGELALLQNCTKFLVTLGANERGNDNIVKSESFHNLVKLSHSGRLATGSNGGDQLELSPAAQQGLLTGLVQCGGSYEEFPRYVFLRRLLEPLFNNFKSLVMADNFYSIYDQELTKSRVIHHIENFTALCEGLYREVIDCTYSYHGEALKLSIFCLEVYYNYRDVVDAIMGLFLKTCDYSIAAMPRPQVYSVHGLTFEMLKTFERRHILTKRNYNHLAEEERWSDLLMLIKIIYSVTEVESEIPKFRPLPTLEPCVVVIFGLRLIFPFINAEVLKVPEICLEFYTLLQEVFYMQCIAVFPVEDVTKEILGWIEVGLGSYGDEVACLCLKFIWLACEYLLQHRREVAQCEVFRPFLKITLNLIFSQEISRNVLKSSSFLGVCGLIALYKEDFVIFMTEVIEAQPGKGLRDELIECTESLRRNRITGVRDGDGYYRHSDIRKKYNQLLTLATMCNCKQRTNEDFSDRFSMKHLSLALTSN